MDSIYYSAPRPYNKYPRGYRPVQDAEYSNSRLRPSSSWSSFSQASDQRSATLPRFPSTCVSPDHTFPNTWAEDASHLRRPFRTESSSTLFDNFNSNLSPRELSPLSVNSEYCNTNNNGFNMNRSVQSPVATQEIPRCYDNVPRSVYEQSNSYGSKENEFLANLQRQKEQAELFGSNRNEMTSSWYGPADAQKEWSQPQQPRRLAKTQSDVSFDTLPKSTYHPSITAQNNGHNYQQRLDGFFRNRVIEPNWMTDPPPPKSFREDYVFRSSNPMSTSLNSNFDKFRLDPSFREEHLGHPRHDRMSRSMPHAENFRSYHRDEPIYDVHAKPFYQREEESRTARLPQSSMGFSNPTYIDRQIESDLRYQNVPSTAVAYRERRVSQNRYPESHNNRNSFYSSDPIQLSHNRILHIHPLANLEGNAHKFDNYSNPISQQPQEQHERHQQYASMQPQRARIQSPLREFARMTSPNRESVVDIHQPSERIFSPVESKVYNRSGPTVINGFTSNRHSYNSHSDDDESRTRRETSQPPVAVIEPNINVNMPSDPIPYHKPQFGYQQRGNREFSKMESHSKPISSHNNPTFVSTHQRHQNPMDLSPISNYDNNDSDLDIEEMARKALPKYLRDVDKTGRNRNGMYGDNLQGILIKNPSLHRSTSKKVVFIDQEKASTGSSEVPPHIRSYDDAVEEAIEKWTKLTDQIGGDIAVMKPMVLKVFSNLRHYLWTAAGMAEPSADEANKMLGEMIKLMTQITEFKDNKRNTPQFNHLSTIAEGLPAVGWVVVKKTPAPYIKEYIDASMFFINRILKEFKETDPRHVEWTKAWKEIFEEMQKFVRQTHTTGLVWNSAPGSTPGESPSAVSAAPKSGGGAPPPPPPPPPIPADLFANMPAAPSDKDKSNRDALFASINRGESVTAGLKKVTADMQTHKNPNLRGNAAVPSGAKTAGGPSAKPAQPVKKPPKKELQDGKQWNVEYFVNDQNIVIDVVDKKQTIYIFRCENSVIKVNGKANSITLDGCKKTSIVFDALVAQCETINCQSVQIQTLGELPTLSIQKTDGCQVYLSKVSQGAEIITSKSSEMNILVQTADDGDYVEFPVPEQFKTTFVNGKLVTTVSDIV